MSVETVETVQPGRSGWAVLAVALLPALGAIAWHPGFVTQDGPAHLYNAHVLLESLRPDSPFRAVYAIRWQPLPNWAGHLSLMGLMAAGIPPRAADRLLAAATLAGFAASLFWLRRRVAGERGPLGSALLCSLLALSMPWLFGFTSFVIGACLFCLTLGLWWRGRERPDGRWALAIAGLLTLGYFAHLVSLGLTVVALVWLAAIEPGPARRRRWVWTLASLAPLVPLGVLYRGIMRGGGGIQPLWMELKNPASLASWKAQLGWVDPITIVSRSVLPFVERPHAAFLAFTPVLWLAVGLAALFGDAILAGTRRRGWAGLAVLFILGGLFGPDTLGPKHGNYLSQRVFWLGLAALVPALDLTTGRPLGKLGVGCLAIALAVQSAFVWDYARRADRLVGEVMQAAPAVGTGQRVGTLWLELRQRFRPNPRLHVDNLLGIGTGNVIWNNYEAAHYYFPVQVRPDVPHPPPLAFENLSLLDDPAYAGRRAQDWAALLQAHHPEIDVLIVWGRDATGLLDPITARWFEPVEPVGKARLWRRKAALVER
jgi:hypothetical protein